MGKIVRTLIKIDKKPVISESHLVRLTGFLLTLIALLLLLVPAPVLAIGLGVSPGKLNINDSCESSAIATLSVINTGNGESSYRVYVAEEAYEGWFNIEPKEFVLPPKASKTVEISIKPPLGASVQYKTHICVVSLPSGGGLKIGAGIRVPVDVNVSDMSGLITTESQYFRRP